VAASSNCGRLCDQTGLLHKSVNQSSCPVGLKKQFISWVVDVQGLDVHRSRDATHFELLNLILGCESPRKG
jgi:hypothetical protein